MAVSVGSLHPHNELKSSERGYWRVGLTRLWNTIAARSWLAVTVVGALPLILRVAMLPWHPMPKPQIMDEFSHLLIADTFASGRIVNPTHPFWEHFETIYEFQRPAYASEFMPGHGLVMAVGQLIGGHAWWGVWASCGLMCGAVC